MLDTPAEPLFDTLARCASMLCGTPIALVSLVDEHRQWFKANIGSAGVRETPRELALCAHAILDGRVLEVPDLPRLWQRGFNERLSYQMVCSDGRMLSWPASTTPWPPPR